VDGVTAAALLVKRSLRSADARPTFLTAWMGLWPEPRRSEAKDVGVRVVVTVDCGIRSPAEAMFGNRLGLISCDRPPFHRLRLAARAGVHQLAERLPLSVQRSAGVGLAFSWHRPCCSSSSG
jgi:hypothetical protein